MNSYDVWCPLIGKAKRNAFGVLTQDGNPVLRVKSPDSFTARRDFAAMHAGMETSDVAASRVWDTEED
jgi:hypothetical protein